MSYFNLFLLFFCAFAGGLATFFFKNDQSKNLKLVLSFSGAYLFSITVLHLLPDVYENGNHTVGIFIMIGFAFQIILEQFSQGIEHGHIHYHNKQSNTFPIGIIISLSIHAFLEGMPLALNSTSPLVYGIALHHIPASFALASILQQNKISKTNIVFLLLLFAIMTPLGLFASSELSNGTIENISVYFDLIMAVVIGMFLHISTTILFESSVDHRFNLYKIIAILIGGGIALGTFIFH